MATMAAVMASRWGRVSRRPINSTIPSPPSAATVGPALAASPARAARNTVQAASAAPAARTASRRSALDHDWAHSAATSAATSKAVTSHWPAA
jgi:hypothetical protein